jgi:hypothetical protein
VACCGFRGIAIAHKTSFGAKSCGVKVVGKATNENAAFTAFSVEANSGISRSGFADPSLLHLSSDERF